AALQQLVEEQRFGAAGQQAVPECTEHGKVEPRVRQLQTQQVLPVDAGADCLRRLAISEMLPKLHDGYQREPPWGQARVPPGGDEGSQVFVLKDGPQDIAERQIRMAFGKGGAGHAGGFFRDRRDEVRVERHARRPSAEGVKTRQTSRSVLCHSPLARSTPWREGNLYRYFV